jgi:hypothetical protein
MSFSPSFGCLSDLSLGSFSQLFLSAFSVGSCLAVFFRLLFSLVSSLQRNFLLVIFAENASNDSIWIRLARIFPTRVSSLLSAGFFFPSRRLMFDEMSSICSLSIRLVQAIPTLVSFCNLGLYWPSYHMQTEESHAVAVVVPALFGILQHHQQNHFLGSHPRLSNQWKHRSQLQLSLHSISLSALSRVYLVFRGFFSLS